MRAVVEPLPDCRLAGREACVTGSSGRLPLIDALRAIAALSIFVYHALFVTGNLRPGSYGWFLNAGVPLFYAISGLLLYRPWAAAIARGDARPSTGRYGVHRVMRIVPAYWIALPLVVIVLDRTGQLLSLSGVITYFGFLQMYRLSTFAGGIGQAWTLGVEVAFYLSVPLFGLVASRFASGAASEGSRLGRQLLLIGSVAGLSIVWKAVFLLIYGSDSADVLIPMTVLPAAADQFAVGMAIAVLLSAEGPDLRPRRIIDFFRSRAWLPAAAGVMAFLLLGVVDPPVGGPVGIFGDIGLSVAGGPGLLLEHELKALVACGLVVAAVAGEPGRGAVGRVLGFRPLAALGTVSYGFYLWHLAILIVFAGALTMGAQVIWAGGHGGLIGGILGVVIAFAVTVVVAASSWRFIEKKAIARSHRVGSASR